VLVFFPLAFSPVCTDQFTLYQEVLDDLRAQGADLYGVVLRLDIRAARLPQQLGVEIPMLSISTPRAQATRAWASTASRTASPSGRSWITGPDRTVRMRWVGEHPGVCRGERHLRRLAGTTAGA